MNMMVATLSDLAGELRALLAFAAVLLPPGFCVGWLTDVAGFRRRRGTDRLAWSVALSFGVSGIAAVLGGRWFSLGTVCWGFGALTLGAGLMLVWERFAEPSRKRDGRSWRAAAWFAVWAIFVGLELTDIGVGRRLFMSVTVYDHALRGAFVDAVMRTGVPPLNPLLAAGEAGVGHAAPMRYYYFWYVLCAAAAKIAGVSARQALIASCAWGGIGLWAAVALCCRYFLTGARRSGVAVLLLSVTGLDLLAVAGNWMAGGATDADMEWWGVDQVASWMDTLLWVPHHVAALVCCVTAWLLLWMSGKGGDRKRWPAVAVAGVCLASAFGLSTYVAAAFGMVLALWVLMDRAGRQRLGSMVVAYLLSVALLLPYLRELRAQGPGTGSGSALTLGVRKLINPASLEEVEGFRELRRSHPALGENVAAAVLLVPGYLCELGFYGAVLMWAVWCLRRRQALTDAGRTAVILTLAGLLVTTLIRSRVIVTNDFGIRSALVPQFFLVLLGVEWWQQARRGWVRTGMLVLAGVGVGGTIYQVVELRTYLAQEERLGRAGFGELAERNAAMWRMEQAMGDRVPRNAVVQYDTAAGSSWLGYAQLGHINRQIAKADAGCEAVFGGSAGACPGMQEAVARIYGGMDGAEARRECERIGASALIATRWDRVWNDRSGWVWALPPLVETPEVRVLGCENGPG